MTLESFLTPLSLSDDQLLKLAISLSQTYRSLAKESTEQFLATPINVLPDGTETGKMLAIDVGGSNLRVGFVDLLGSSEIARSYDRSWRIGEDVRKGSGADLFGWIGARIAEVVKTCQEDLQGKGQDGLEEMVPMGITWSFPLKYGNDTISNASIMKLGKGFKIPGDPNLGRLILDGYSRHGGDSASLPRLEIAAITNDTVATLASLAYASHGLPSTRVGLGLIVGTGTNAAVMMDLSCLHQSKQDSIKLPAKVDKAHHRVMINTEWSLWGTIGPVKDAGLVTKWDEQLDREGDDPGFMPFEYMTGGRYLGEMVRLVAYDYFVSQQKDNPEHLPQHLRVRAGLHTDYLSDVIATDMSSDELLSSLERDLPASGDSFRWTSASAESMRSIARAIQKRSARLVAAAVVGGLISSGDFVTPSLNHDVMQEHRAAGAQQDLIVAFTGGVISQFPHYNQDCQEAIDYIVAQVSHSDIQQRVILREVLNGGVIGAGILAGTVWNLPQKQRATT